jgi:two-component system, OmpR family, Ni(II)-sensor and/or redox sensor kinase NrsS
MNTAWQLFVMNSQQLFRYSRIRLALWYALVMGVILGLSGLGMYRSLVHSSWEAMEREMESIAGTLHDSLEPMLPISEDPTAVLRRILPELCLVKQPCNQSPTLIQRHTTGISDRSTYYIRLFDHHGQLLAFSPNQPPSLPDELDRVAWQTFRTGSEARYHQFTTILHSAQGHQRAHELGEFSDHNSWGYLQIGRNLAPLDIETQRMRWILLISLLTALGLVVISSWWLSGLAMQPIYESYQRQQQFTANAAHELRSPLASLLATVEAILRMPQANPPATQTMLHTVERQGRRLSGLIADLLFLSSLEHRALTQLFKPCCLNDLVSDLSEEFLELATTAKIHIAHQVPTDEIYVLGSESQLYRLLSNLIANAIQYTPSDGHVLVSLMARDRHAWVTVKDTGIGIAVAEQTRIFDRFYRVDGDRACKTGAHKTGATGLGLAIAQAIAQVHQGSIQIQSEPGKGAAFTVRLPIG